MFYHYKVSNKSLRSGKDTACSMVFDNGEIHIWKMISTKIVVPPISVYAVLSLFLFRLLGRPLLLLHLLDGGRVPLVLPALGVHVVEVERVDDLLLLKQELLHLATDDCRDTTSLLAILRMEIVSLQVPTTGSFALKYFSCLADSYLKHDDGGELPREGRCVDEVFFAHVGVPTHVNLA